VDIDKAIELIKDTRACCLLRGEVDHAEAAQLGIEALKKWKEYRACDRVWWGHLLIGETELASVPRQNDRKGVSNAR